MFHRVIHENWTTIIPVVSFWILFVIFLGATLRSVLMKKSEAERMAALPLDDSPPPRPCEPAAKR